MIDFFYKVKFPIGCNKLCSTWNHLLSRTFNIAYYIYCKFTKPCYGLNTEQRDEEIIISFTSFPARFNSVYYSVRALLNQTLKPDRIILWLAEEECKDISLPKCLENLKKYGLEVKYASENLRPHNKLYHTLRKYPEAIVITVDDDIIYDSKLVERLYKAHINNQRCVCCNMAHEITLVNSLPDLYDNWNGGAINKNGISNYYVALGVGGVLYPSNCFDEEYFDASLIKSLSLSADDLWLKITELRLGIPVLKINKVSKIPFVVGGSQKVALGHENNGMKKNDIIMKKLCEHYKINWGKL